MSLYARLAALALVLLAIGAAWWKLEVALNAREALGYKRAQAEAQAASELQREGNRGRTRQAEQKFAARVEVREKFIVETITEVRHAAQSLAVCPVPEPLRLLVNAAAECAGSDRPAACGADK